MQKLLKIYFKNAEEVADGLEKVAGDLFFEIANEQSAALTVEAERAAIEGYKVCLQEGRAVITYGERKVCFFRGLMQLCRAISEGRTELSLEEAPSFKTNGAQLDLARNNPLSRQGLEYFIRHSAIMGLNRLLLYLEDMFELPGYPYFGYMRGRYTKEELRALDDYADSLGVELCAVIEVFGHQEKYLKYNAAAPVKGSAQVLLVGEEETYIFIEEMMKSIQDCLKSRTIFLGCDEVRTANEGAYRAKHGEVPLEEVFHEHINRVYNIAERLGLKPYIYDDMYFYLRYTEPMPAHGYCCDEHVVFDSKIHENFPKGMSHVLWNYTEEDEDKMVRIMQKSKELGGNMLWLGAVRSWQSYCMKFTPTITTAVVGIKAAKRAGVEEIAVSIWEDSGETPHFFMLPAMLIYAQLDYGEEYDEAEINREVRFLYGADFSDFKQIERADKVHDHDVPELATKFLLYNDPLFGLLDYQIKGLALKDFYGDLVRDYENRGPAGGPLKLCFDQFKAILSVLELKADYGLRLKAAYDRKDRAALRTLSDESLILKARFKTLLETDWALFTSYYRSFGYELLEMRRSAMISRFETVHRKLEKYLSGESEIIEELEQERLPFGYNQFENPGDDVIFFGADFMHTFTANV